MLCSEICKTINELNPNVINDLQSKSVDWFLYDIGFRHEEVKKFKPIHENNPLNLEVPANTQQAFGRKSQSEFVSSVWIKLPN